MTFNDIKQTVPKIEPIQVTMDNGICFLIKPYLSILEKIELLQLVLQNAQEDTLYNPLKLDMYFHIYLILLYTDIECSLEDKENIEELYDVFCKTGLIDTFIKNIPETEYDTLHFALQELVDIRSEHNSKLASAIQSLIHNLPQQAEEFGKIMSTFDLDKFQQITNLAVAANGGRDIKTNQPVK